MNRTAPAAGQTPQPSPEELQARMERIESLLRRKDAVIIHKQRKVWHVFAWLLGIFRTYHRARLLLMVGLIFAGWGVFLSRGVANALITPILRWIVARVVVYMSIATMIFLFCLAASVVAWEVWGLWNNKKVDEESLSSVEHAQPYLPVTFWHTAVAVVLAATLPFFLWGAIAQAYAALETLMPAAPAYTYTEGRMWQIANDAETKVVKFSATNIDPVLLGLPETAREVTDLRTEKTVTFEIEPGKFAAIGMADQLFVRTETGALAPIDDTGRERNGEFVFNRLPQDVKITFDLESPSYTLSQGDNFMTVSYGLAASAQIEDSHTVSYAFGTGVTLKWKVNGASIKESIEVATHNLPDLTFAIDTSDDLIVAAEGGGLVFTDGSGDTVFRTGSPVLTDIADEVLDHPIAIEETDEEDEFAYVFSQEGLALPYIIDPSSGPLSPGTIANDATQGTQAWSNLTNAAASDDAYAVASGETQVSQYLKATNFGFSIPAGATIDGIVAEIERKCSDNDIFAYCTDNNVYLVKDGTIQGDDKGDVANWDTSDAYETYGGASDLWGLTFTADDINSSSFGGVINVLLTSGISPP